MWAFACHQSLIYNTMWILETMLSLLVAMAQRQTSQGQLKCSAGEQGSGRSSHQWRINAFATTYVTHICSKLIANIFVTTDDNRRYSLWVLFCFTYRENVGIFLHRIIYDFRLFIHNSIYRSIVPYSVGCVAYPTLRVQRLSFKPSSVLALAQ